MLLEQISEYLQTQKNSIQDENDLYTLTQLIQSIAPLIEKNAALENNDALKENREKIYEQLVNLLNDTQGNLSKKTKRIIKLNDLLRRLHTFKNLYLAGQDPDIFKELPLTIIDDYSLPNQREPIENKADDGFVMIAKPSDVFDEEENEKENQRLRESKKNSWWSLWQGKKSKVIYAHDIFPTNDNFKKDN